MRLHHISYVTADLEKKAASLCELFGFRRAGDVVVDEHQGVRILCLDMGDGHLLELLEPLGKDSPVQRHLDSGGGLYHLCFEVDRLDETLRRIEQMGEARVVKPAAEAPAFGGCRVAFVVTSDMDLVEFVEAAPE